MMPCKRGDVVLTAFPESNLRHVRRRPALVVQSDNLNTEVAQVIVAMISSQMRRAGRLGRVKVLAATPRGEAAGILDDSVIMTDNLVTVRAELIIEVIGRINDMSDVDEALRHTLGLL